MAREVSVELLWDIEQIKQLKARYFRFLDAQDWDAFLDVFTEDCRHHLPSDAGADITIDNLAYIEMLKQTLVPGVTTHHGHMPEITVHSDTEASGIWSMFDYVETEGVSIQGYGHYHETYRKCADGKWRIASKDNVRQRVDPVAHRRFGG